MASARGRRPLVRSTWLDMRTQGRGPFRDWPESRGGGPQLALERKAWPGSSGGRPRHGRSGNGILLVHSPEVERGELRTRRLAPRCSCCGRRPRQKGGLFHEHSSACSNGTRGGQSSRGRTQRDLVMYHLGAVEREGDTRHPGPTQRRAERIGLDYSVTGDSAGAHAPKSPCRDQRLPGPERHTLLAASAI